MRLKGLVAVLSGDVVHSTALTGSARERLFETLQQGSAELTEWLGGKVVQFPLDVFRGDSWQLLLRTPERALEAALFLRTFLMARTEILSKSEVLDQRIAVAVGRVSFVPGARASEGEGPAFQRSGRLLDALQSSVDRLRLDVSDFPSLRAWEWVFRYVDRLLSHRLTPARAKVVEWKLRGEGDTDIAGRLRITQPAVTQSVKGVDWHLLEETIQAFRHDMKSGVAGAGRGQVARRRP